MRDQFCQQVGRRIIDGHTIGTHDTFQIVQRCTRHKIIRKGIWGLDFSDRHAPDRNLMPIVAQRFGDRGNMQVVPRPCRTSRYPSSFNSPMALRMVVRLTLNCASSSCSEGRSVPTFRCPSVISCFNIPYTVRYNACLLIERPSFLPDFCKKIFETYPTITSYGGIVNRNTEMF